MDIDNLDELRKNITILVFILLHIAVKQGISGRMKFIRTYILILIKKAILNQ